MLMILLGCIFFLFIAYGCQLVYTHYIWPYYVLKRRVGLSGPPPTFFYGNYPEIAKLGTIKSMEKWMSQYGPTFIYYLGARPLIATQDVEVIKSIMVKNFDCFCNRIRIPIPLKKGKNTVFPMMRDEQWRNMRHFLTPTFSGKKLRLTIPLVDQLCAKFKSKVAAFCDTGKSADMSALFKEHILKVILTTSFSRDVDLDGGQENVLFSAINTIFSSLERSSKNAATGEKLLMLLSHFPWFTHVMRFIARRTKDAKSWDYLEDTALKITEDRVNDMKVNNGYAIQDLLQSILNAQEKQRDVYPLTNDEVVTTVMSIILAGYDTTSNSLTYCAYLLAINPAVQDKLVREIRNYYDVNPDSSLQDAADNIDYVEMVLKEAMRLYPAATPARDCCQTCAVTDDLTIEKGIFVTFPLYLLHRNPKYWTNPDEYDPERFNPNKEQAYPTFAYLPFGEGQRNCIAKRHALLYDKMTLVSFYKEMHFKRAPETEVPLKISHGATIVPVNPIKLCVVSNSN